MNAHACTKLTRGCYRCDLNINEMRTIKRRDYAKTTRLWGRCEGCGCKWQWSGLTEHARDGMSTIARSGCLCYGDGKLTAPTPTTNPAAAATRAELTAPTEEPA